MGAVGVMSKSVNCPQCNGSGIEADVLAPWGSRTCSRCNGTRRVAIDSVAKMTDERDAARETLQRTEDERRRIVDRAEALDEAVNRLRRELSQAEEERETQRVSADQLRTDRDAARVVLREVEWSGPNGGECPACWRYRHHGHAPDCALAAAKGEQ